MEYDFRAIEAKWQKEWRERGTYKVDVDPSRPKFYVLDMFPYPSGAGLHVGHPLGYIASDIYSRYKRLCGFNVLHPMGYDAFGLPAEQYAIQTGQHPAVTTTQNINRYREQLDKIVSRSIGAVRYAPVSQSITSGRSGHLCRCSRTITTMLSSALAPSRSWWLSSLQTVLMVSMRLARRR